MTKDMTPALTDIRYIKDLLARHGFAASKGLGQNFLINPSVCPRMADACGAGPNMGALEIGPGIGVLTRELASRGGKVAAVELDERLRPVLAETLADSGAALVFGDALKLDLAALAAERFGGKPFCVCANLPYYLTSPLIMRLLESRLPADNITVMVQREAARRLCAADGSRESGAVTLAVRYYAQPDRLFDVSRGSFLPAPKVDSTVIRLLVRHTPPVRVRDEALLFRVIRTAFGQRRKTVANALSAGLGLPRDDIIAALTCVAIPPLARAEQLTLPQFAQLTEEIQEGRVRSSASASDRG